MSSSDWEEVKRLAADFQRAQLASSAQRLSESNCVELINKLIGLNLLKVHFTADGKGYITPQQVQREIEDELYVAGGRLSLVEISDLLGLSITVVQVEAKALVQHNANIQMIFNELISKEFRSTFAEEINEKLMKEGTVSVDDLSAEYQLPPEFIRGVLQSKLGDVVNAVQDSSNRNMFYTEKYLARLKAKVTGLMTAVTSPTPLHTLVQQKICNEKLFINTIEKLIACGRVCGELVGNRERRGCVYMPAIHSNAQSSWIDNFFKQNGYLEHEFLTQVGIDDPAGYIQRRYGSSHKLLTFPGVCVGDTLLQQVDSAIEEVQVTHSYVDISVIVPSNFSKTVTRQLISHCLDSRRSGSEAKTGKGRKAQQTAAPVSGPSCSLVGDSSCVVSDVLMSNIRQQLETEMATRGQKLVAAGGYKPKITSSKAKTEDPSDSNKKEERRKKAAGGKSGGGTQGRETKTRSTKNKKGGRRGGHEESSDEEMEKPTERKQAGGSAMKFPDVEYLPLDELAEQISKLQQLEDADEEMVEEIAGELHPWTRKQFNSICERCYTSLVSSGSSGKKKSFQQLQDKVIALYTSCKLAEKGVLELEASLQQQLSRYLLKSNCSELLAEMVLYTCDGQTDTSAKDLTPESRLQMISKIPDAGDDSTERNLFTAAHKAVQGSDLSAFFTALEELSEHVGIQLNKKKDNKRDRQLLVSHRAGLLEQLSACHDPALCLHLAVLLLFHTTSGHILQASGKFVPQLVAHLNPSLNEDLNELLAKYQGLVMKKLTTSADSEEIGSINSQLEELTPLLQEKAITFKKIGGHA